MTAVHTRIAPGGDLETLRANVRGWLADNTPVGWHEELRTAAPEGFRDFNVRYARLLRDAGLLAVHWPREFAGPGFSFDEQLVIQEEMVRADFPQPRLLEIALQHVAATLMAHGTPGQQRLLADILDGAIWCQGFSEPNAGSDLASLRTSAMRDGDFYVVNGQKVWSSYADHAKWCLLLVRTDPHAPKHRGLSLLIVDMATPGIELRPIRQATGTEEFYEIFFTDVRVPTANLIGEENAGWRMAQTTLATERVFSALELQEKLALALDVICEEARNTPISGARTLADDDGFRQQLAACAEEVEVLGLIARKMVESIQIRGDVGPEGSLVKLFYSETLQRLTALAVRMEGMPAMIDERREFATTWVSGHWLIDHLKSWNWTIAAGSNEIQRNIIGERVLGLPREPQG